MLAQAVTAMAYHGYLELQGGQKLVEFIVSQCAIQDVDEEVSIKVNLELSELLYSLSRSTD